MVDAFRILICKLSFVLQVVFIVLKLLGLISWSWAVTLLPFLIISGIIIIAILLVLIAIIFSKKTRMIVILNLFR